VQTTSPDFGGNYSDLTCWLIMGNEVKAEPSKWDGLGLRGNQSGTLEVDNVVVGPDRMVGPRATAPPRTTSASTPSSCSAPRPAGTASRSACSTSPSATPR